MQTTLWRPPRAFTQNRPSPRDRDAQLDRVIQHTSDAASQTRGDALRHNNLLRLGAGEHDKLAMPFEAIFVPLGGGQAARQGAAAHARSLDYQGLVWRVQDAVADVA